MKISFIIPCFNCEKTLPYALDSIINSNLDVEDEIVCVDDGSTDQTKAVLEQCTEKNHFIQVITHEKNKGGAATRNTAVESAKHDWIFCLDSDNILPQNSISRLKELIKSQNAKGAFFEKAVLFQEDPTIPQGERVYQESKIPLEGYLSRWNIPGASGNYLYQKNLWKKVEGYPEFSGALDTTGFGLRVAALGVKLACDRGGFYYHRTGHESYWQRFRRGNVSQVMYRLLEPYFSKLEKGEVEYLQENRDSFYGKLSERPLRLKKSWWKRMGIAR